jgi:hypothetical protein
MLKFLGVGAASDAFWAAFNLPNKLRKLFAEGMVKYASLCTTVDDLGNYWMNNQLQLESLKETHMDLYKSVVAQFTTMKKNLVEGNANV